ncbi:MAG: tRNA uridine-5-carboxymethylaminomethyl(34) synthesis GTPase MnmE [Termitinemataceae bacterium]|nr:MAG: tRNA uridine-5-carboxymethylaminomethyl(34) synthesis GTPase MnmE [Termitinemataceae bacterium]
MPPNFTAAYNDASPIAAIATASGKSALAIVRTSGKGSIELLSRIFSSPQKLLATRGNTVVYGWIIDGTKKIDEVLISVYRSPSSFTGEDSADINCHGGNTAPDAVLKTLFKAGFRQALPGEFSLRGFINGKSDLTKAESIMEIVCAKTDAERYNAVSRLNGSLEKQINKIKNDILAVLSGIEILLDYSELDGVGDGGENGLSAEQTDKLKCILDEISLLLESYRVQNIYRTGALVVIAGQANAGKSSLFNLMLKSDRSIVTDIPGTTRDWVDDFIVIENIPLRIVDTAGLRTSAETVEKIGIERSLDLICSADLVLYVIDAEKGITDYDKNFLQTHKECNKLLLWNKCDIKHCGKVERYINVSAKTTEGFSGLCKKIASTIRKNSGITESAQSQLTLGSERQKILAETAYNNINHALQANAGDMPLDIISPLIREALNALGLITGEVSTADILQEMFSKFCVGK